MEVPEAMINLRHPQHQPATPDYATHDNVVQRPS